MLGLLDSYYILSEQERLERQEKLNSRQARLRLNLVWLGVVLVFVFASLSLGIFFGTYKQKFAGVLVCPMIGLWLIYSVNIVFFWLDIDRFMRGLRYTDHEMYLSPYLQLDNEKNLHFFTIADLIASGALSSSQGEIRKQIERGVVEGFSKIKHCIDSGELDRTAELRFHQYTLHPQTLARWGFRLYQPNPIQFWWAIFVAVIAWPRVAYVSSFTRRQTLRLSHIQRFTFSSRKAKNL
ncbi:MAG: hypothetical protein DWQ07_17905 [Chloroflexi bacterium]|nr:MAG: hypothetical protein DWQ07_17905 [Chloroflexota bacterium]